MAPSRRSSRSSTPAPTGQVGAPTLGMVPLPLSIPSSDTSSAESMLWEPALDANFRLPELSPSEAEAFKLSEHPEFDECGVYSRYMQFADESAPLPQAGDEEPDLVVLASTPAPGRCHPSPLRATLLPHTEEVTMPTIGNVGGFRRRRSSFVDLTGSTPPPPAPVPSVQPPERRMTVADFDGVPYRYPPIDPAPGTNWNRTVAAREYSAALYYRGAAVQASMPPGTSSPRGFQYPRTPSTTRAGALSFTSAVGESSSNQAPREAPRCSAPRPPRARTGRRTPMRSSAAKPKECHSYVNDADILQKVESNLVQRVNAQSAYLKIVKKNFEALAEASKHSSKL